ncbi:glycoside hydrolase family 11 protein [[Clostridium] polysaccharolyticum]|jgi:peptidoglycan/xylan/chitin deacetylase (PgdA/CDA1 family)|uniref:endo-1,4-beta-xylanase n=1 Tax=[Clostridium] polysaccharolyticum TaxID=29364 RepID=A0A1H9YWH6_9FIRM|nr:glycoside hydrolase family 11 protein [[Clostridium] polysaccharolyticum]SES73042.1 Peptidoglycan/xylan/chitin deacetylase, PgdA/CDA1 family [[Clostridium] polysaccharolyticum]
MRRKMIGFVVSLLLCLQLVVPAITVQAAQTLYNNTTGNQDGYDYELWKDYGTTSMTLNGGGAFSCSWSNIGNALFRKGIKFDSTKTYDQMGNITIDYGCDYRPSGNSYLCVYGWSKNPLVEYYIVESWGSWRPPGAQSKGTISVDGGTYDVYETTRVNQPSIEGDTTFKQFWSVRTSKKTSGTISVTEHFKAWSRMGMRLGKLYEAALNVEGYQSSGSANVYSNTIKVGGNGSNTPAYTSPATGNTGTVSAGSKMECEDMTISGQYAGKINNPFDGVALYANEDAVTYTQNFKNGTNDFTLRGCSNNGNMARVDLYIAGQNKGTFYYGDEYPAEYTIKNVSHGTGNQEVKLVVTADDGQWDAYIDNLQISGEGQSSTGGTATGGNETPAAGSTQNVPDISSEGTKLECENGTLGGQYAGPLSSPFDGAALYGNNDSVTFNQYFANGTHDFTLRACSNNSNMAKVDLYIGGEMKGTFYYGDEYPAEYTIKNVSHGTGNQEIKLVVTADDGQWDAYLDYLLIGGAGTSSSAAPVTNTNTNTNTNLNASTKMVALTFDDGPSSTTNDVLDVLQRNNAVATFFLIGNQVNASTKATMQRQLSMGCELACHSYTHSDMGNMGAWQVQNEISQCVNAIKSQVNTDIKFFRAPYLSTSNTMFQNINLTFIQGIDCKDWESYVSANERANTILNTATDGSIILLHDFQGNNNTVQALPAIIQGLRNKGYTFVTVSDLFKYKGVNPNVGYKVWSNVYR